jgi:hypothetical protein
MRDRSERRAHIERLKKKRRFYWGKDLHHINNELDPGRQLGMVVDTPKPCSCWMCSNPRRGLNERTLQEISFEEVNKLVE